MSVVNVKVKYIRPDYKDLKEWCESKDNVYIARRGVVFIDTDKGKQRYPEKDSIFANPFKIGKDGDRNEVIDKYQKFLLDKIKNEKVYKDEFLKLKGKTLGCWCKPDNCHGDVIIKLLNELE